MKFTTMNYQQFVHIFVLHSKAGCGLQLTALEILDLRLYSVTLGVAGAWCVDESEAVHDIKFKCES